MPVYLDTRGNSVLSVAICDRCSRKFAYTDLMPDPNFPGMRVCKDDLDNYDPWRLPARQTENIALRFPRPDTPLGQPANLINTQGAPNDPVQYDNFFIEGTAYGVAGAPGVLNLNSAPVAVANSTVVRITNVNPDNGPQAGGTTVVLTGSLFTGVTTLTFGGINAASFTIDSPTQITAVTPAYPVTGDVNIQAVSPAGTAIAYGAFTYN